MHKRSIVLALASLFAAMVISWPGGVSRPSLRRRKDRLKSVQVLDALPRSPLLVGWRHLDAGCLGRRSAVV
jgi:hypothetical protein